MLRIAFNFQVIEERPGKQKMSKESRPYERLKTLD